MNFLTLSRLNAFMNIISGNMLPVTSKKTNLPINLKIYWVIVWMIQLSYLTACILGIHYVPTENSLKDSTVAMAVTVEAITLSVYMNSRKNLLRQLIEQLNETLKEGDEMLRTITMETVNPLQKGACCIFCRAIFDQRVLSRWNVAQYKYLRIRFAMILRHNLKNVEEDVWQSVPWKEEQNVKQEMRMLTCHYESIIKMATILKKVLAPNIGVLYINNVFRFSFLSIMFVMASATEMEKYLIMSYSIGALIQLYMLCFSIQELFEASIAVADDAFYEKWCVYDTSLLRATAIMTFGSKLECKLSSVRSIDLTLPSFMSILNQAYSMCLLFLKAR
ncbi:uncharacterized protein LOC114872255 isoform X3 [Osmia bicornis bicornis]|uniref:uncharacterized protein LOC114872255 isoform X3 n=1 Tax=Osmia bicornis bicornis TaxID=1437191 RepID=UPI001EAEB99E|nr:uncharacterized protein LOC114872255 isoform X3 [Osmia bicornis bicornis]